MPADTVDYGGVIAGFADVGYTNGGLGLNTNIERGEIRVDQEFYPLSTPITAQSFVLNTELAEYTPANFQRTTGLGTLASVAPGAGTRGHDDLALNSTIVEIYQAWLFEIQQQNLMPFRQLMYRGTITGSPSPQITPDNPATLALEVTALVDTGFTGYAGVGRVGLLRRVLPQTS